MSTDNLYLQRITLIVFLICLVVGIMWIARPFLSPLFWGLMIALSSVVWLEKIRERLKMKWMPLVFIHIIFILFLISAIFYFLVYEVKLIIFAIPELDDRLIRLEENFVSWLAGMGIDIKDQLNLNYLTSKVAENSDDLIALAGGLGKQLGNIFLVMIYTFFFLYYKDILPRFVIMRLSDPGRIEHVRRMTYGVIRVISSYLSGTLLMTFGLAIILYLMFLLLGVEYALFFSVFVALLNLIPYIGNPIGMVVVVLYAFLTNDGILIPLIVLIGINVANQIQEQVLRPLILGDRLHLNAFTVFLSVVIGGTLWGVSGMILFIPLAGIIKIILEDNVRTRPYALFFGEIEPNEKEGEGDGKKKKVLFRIFGTKTEPNEETYSDS